jgi:mRNA interferase MazF
MKYKVVLVPFPFDDLSSTKVRPAVCLTEPLGVHRHIVLAFITSRVPMHLLATDLIINTDALGFAQTGLRVASTLQLHRMVTATTAIILRELSVLPPQMQEQVSNSIEELARF